MSNATQPPKDSQATDTTKNNTDLASKRNPPPTGWTTGSHQHQAHHDTTSQQTTWHRLLGTLLSSQRTDARPSWPFDPFGGNRSNLAVRLPPVNFAAPFGIDREEAVGAGQSGRQERVEPASDSAETTAVPWSRVRVALGGTDHRVFPGVRSSLPGA